MAAELAPDLAETHRTFCRICEALCGLEVTVRDGRIESIAPDREHVATRGFACVKGIKQSRLYDSPDRLTTPMKRVGDQHVPATWEEAYDAIGAKVRQLRRDHHADAVGMYVGTAAGFSVLHPVFANGFMQGLGSKSLYATATQDCANKFAVADAIYGFPFIQPFPDVDRVQCLIVVGANPAISKWSFLQVPNPVQRLRAIVRRGGRLVFVDPRRTESAQAAGEHVAIRPGTDVFFYLAFLHEVLRRPGAVDEARVAAHMRGLQDLRRLAEPWTPERQQAVTRVPAESLRDLVTSYLEADGAALYCSTGVNMGGHGALAFWIQEAINALTGNLDRPGGALVGHGVFDFPSFAKRRGLLVSKDRSRVGGFRKVNDAFPGGVMADEILTPGDRQLRALFVTGGNPLITMAGANRLRRAFEELELLVTVDIQMSETSTLAHWVLPAVSPFQRPDLPFIFPLMLGLQATPYLQATRAVVPPQGAQRDEATIYLGLAKACGIPLFGSRVAQRLLEAATWWHSRKRSPGAEASVPQEALLNAILRLTRQGSFRALLEGSPHGRLRPGHTGGDFLGRRVLTDDGKLDLAPAELVAQADATLAAAYQRELDDSEALKLITRRAITTHNSWTHNDPAYLPRTPAGPDGERAPATNQLYMHPRDAERLGLDEGALADVRTEAGAVRVPVSLLAELSVGTVALPHGWGHQAARGMRVASATAGVNVNVLASDGADHVDPFSGMSQLTGLPVDVRPAAGPRELGSWTGLPPELDGRDALERELTARRGG